MLLVYVVIVVVVVDAVIFVYYRNLCHIQFHSLCSQKIVLIFCFLCFYFSFFIVFVWRVCH